MTIMLSLGAVAVIFVIGFAVGAATMLYVVVQSRKK